MTQFHLLDRRMGGERPDLGTESLLREFERTPYDERVAAQVAARLAGGERHEPRSFFWKRDKSTPVEASANEPRVEASQARTSGR